MASRSKATTGTPHPGSVAGDRTSRSEKRERGTDTRESVRDILRRYRETFERLGR